MGTRAEEDARRSRVAGEKLFQKMRTTYPGIEILSEWEGYKGEVTFKRGEEVVTQAAVSLRAALNAGRDIFNPRPRGGRRSHATRRAESLHKVLVYLYGEVEYESPYVDEQTEMTIVIPDGRYIITPEWARREHRRVHLEKTEKAKQEARRQRGEKQRSSHATDFYYKLKEKFPHAQMLTEYQNARTDVRIDFKCGHEPEYVSPARIKRGKGCPLCDRPSGEVRIYESLKRYQNSCVIFWDKSAIWTDDSSLSRRRYDFQVFFPGYDKLIVLEWHGTQHFKSVEKFGGEEGYIDRIKSDELKQYAAERVAWYHAFELRKQADRCLVRGGVDPTIDYMVSNLRRCPVIPREEREYIRYNHNI